MGNNKHISHFYQLISENKAILYKICNSYCSNEAEHEDLLQEMMYHLWKSAQSFKPEHRFTTWMYRVALNVAISHYRKSKSDLKKVSLNDISVDIASTPASSDKELQLQHLQQSIAQLKELDRALILLWLEENSYAEIADVMGISVSNVATRIGRIKEKLKQQLQHLQNT